MLITYTTTFLYIFENVPNPRIFGPLPGFQSTGGVVLKVQLLDEKPTKIETPIGHI